MRGLMFGLAVASLLMGVCAPALAQTPGFNTFKGGGCAGCAAVARPVAPPPRPVAPPPGRTVVVPVPVPQPGWSSSGHSSSTVTVGRNTVTYRDSSSYRSSGYDGSYQSNEWGHGVGWFPFGTGSRTTWDLYDSGSGSWNGGSAPYGGNWTLQVDPTYAPDGMTPLAPCGAACGRRFYTPDAYVGATAPGTGAPAKVLHLTGGGGNATCHITARGAKHNFAVNGVPYWCDAPKPGGTGMVTK